MKNPGFIGIEAIKNTYAPAGFSNFKIEGRSLGSAIILEFLLYYMTKPGCRLKVREEIYLDTMLDPLGMMYEYAEDVTEHIKNRSEYILAFRSDGKAITIMPTLTGYRYFCPYDSDSGLVTGRYCSQLKKGWDHE